MSDCRNHYYAELERSSSSFLKAVEEPSEILKKCIATYINDKKENTTMKVTYNGFTGELTKLERRPSSVFSNQFIYDLSIYDSEKKVTHSFTGVKLEEVQFSGGTVSFSE